MKVITAIVRADTLDDVARAVVNAGARGMTVTEARGFGQQYGHVRQDGPAERAALLLPKLRVEVVVQDQEAVAVAEAIAKTVRTGVIGDGKIWVSPVDAALRIRTGDRDRAAV